MLELVDHIPGYHPGLHADDGPSGLLAFSRYQLSWVRTG